MKANPEWLRPKSKKPSCCGIHAKKIRITTVAPDEKERFDTLKVESLAVMSRATEPYSNHMARVEDLRLELEKATEYARWIPDNEYTVGQWELLASPTNNLLGGFLVKWEAKSSLSPALIRGKKKQVVRAFDEMIRLESGKIEE